MCGTNTLLWVTQGTVLSLWVFLYSAHTSVGRLFDNPIWEFHLFPGSSLIQLTYPCLYQIYVSHWAGLGHMPTHETKVWNQLHSLEWRRVVPQRERQEQPIITMVSKVGKKEFCSWASIRTTQVSSEAVLTYKKGCVSESKCMLKQRRACLSSMYTQTEASKRAGYSFSELWDCWQLSSETNWNFYHWFTLKCHETA